MVQHNDTTNIVQLIATKNHDTTQWNYELWYDVLVLHAMVRRNGTTNYGTTQWYYNHGRITVNDEGLKTSKILVTAY